MSLFIFNLNFFVNTMSIIYKILFYILVIALTITFYFLGREPLKMELILLSSLICMSVVTQHFVVISDKKNSYRFKYKHFVFSDQSYNKHFLLTVRYLLFQRLESWVLFLSCLPIIFTDLSILIKVSIVVVFLISVVFTTLALFVFDLYFKTAKKYKPYFFFLYLAIFQSSFGNETLLPVYINPFGTAFWAWIPINNIYNIPFALYAFAIALTFFLIIKKKINAHPPI